MKPDPKAAFHRQPHVEFRILTSEKPHVAAGDAFIAFRASTANKRDKPGQDEPSLGLSPFLLSWTLADLLNTRFLSVLSYRLEYNLNWSEAAFVLGDLILLQK